MKKIIGYAALSFICACVWQSTTPVFSVDSHQPSFDDHSYTQEEYVLPTPSKYHLSGARSFNEGTSFYIRKGWKDIRIRMDYNPAVSFDGYDYLEFDIDAELVAGTGNKINASNVTGEIYTYREWKKESARIDLPSPIMTGEKIHVKIPITDFVSDQFDPGHNRFVFIRFQAPGGRFNADVHITDMKVTKEDVVEPPAEEPETPPTQEQPQRDQKEYHALPMHAGYNISGRGSVDGEYAYIRGGWGNVEVRLDYNPALNFSNYESLEFTMDFDMLPTTADRVRTGDIVTQMYTMSGWGNESAHVTLPSIVTNGNQVTVTLPLSNFVSSAYNPEHINFIFFKFYPESGNLDADVLIRDMKLVRSLTADGNSDPEPETPVEEPVEDPEPEEPPVEEPEIIEDGNISSIGLVTEDIIKVTLNGNVNVSHMEDILNWSIVSTDDAQYDTTLHPRKIDRFSMILDNDNGRVYRNILYLHVPFALDTNNTYTINFNSNTDQHPYDYNGTTGHFVTNNTFGPWDITPAHGLTGVAQAIKVNQHGYNTAGSDRYAYVGYWLGTGGTLDIVDESAYTIYRASDNTIAARGTLMLRANDARSGEEVHEIDLSSLSVGEYYIVVDGVGRSYTFRIGGSAFEAFYTAARGLYHQRAGTELTTEYTPWSHEIAHRIVYKVDVLEDWGLKFPSGTPQINAFELEGGWYDAGDFDRRPVHLLTVGHLLTLHEIMPDLGETLNIPESGNGIPDILDEALYGLKSFEILQESHGGVRAGVESTGHPGFTGAADDAFVYWTYTPNRYTSYEFAGVAAHAARLLMDVPGQAARATELRDRAIRAWNWAEAQTMVGTTGPSGNMSSQSTLDRARMSAAGSLFALTNSVTYRDAFGQHAGLINSSYWQNLYGVWGMANAEGSNVNSLRDDARTKIMNSANEHLAVLDRNAYRNGLGTRYSDENIAWGNGTNGVKYAVPAIMAYHFSPEDRYVDAVSLGADFQLGAHPLGMSWMTGLGIKTPEYPLHLTSMYDSISEPVPGLPINGPYARRSSCDSPDYWVCRVYNGFTPNFITDIPAYYSYAPWARMAPMNEFAIWTDMGYTALGYGFLYGVSGEPVQDLSGLTPSDYPLSALTR